MQRCQKGACCAGLGLVISKKLAELMGGSIWVDSRLDQGTTVHFTMQLAWAPHSLNVQNVQVLHPIVHFWARFHA